MPLLLSAGASFFSRRFTLCMLLRCAPHVMRVQQHSELSSGHSMRLVVMIWKLLSISRPVSRWVQKERVQSIKVRRRSTIERMPSLAFIHRHVVCQGNGSHRSPTLVHVAAVLPSLQGVCGLSSTRCYGREVARLSA